MTACHKAFNLRAVLNLYVFAALYLVSETVVLDKGKHIGVAQLIFAKHIVNLAVKLLVLAVGEEHSARLYVEVRAQIQGQIEQLADGYVILVLVILVFLVVLEIGTRNEALMHSAYVVIVVLIHVLGRD